MSARDRPTAMLRCAVTSSDVAAVTESVEWTDDYVWLSASCRCRRATLRGVPARQVDIVVDSRVIDGTLDPRDVVVAEVSEKIGRFDGAARPRIALRVVQGWQAPPEGSITLDASDAGRMGVSIAIGGDGWSGGKWSGSFVRLRADLNDYCPARIVMWHWRRYFLFLPEDDVVALADSWATEIATPPTLAEANRIASRALYRLARALGWRKLTLRERSRLGLGGGQWVEESDYAAAQQLRVDERDRLGVSDASTEAARSGPRVAEMWQTADAASTASR